MASSNDVIFPESMTDILANPINICFGSIPAESTAQAVEGNAITCNQHVGTDLLVETRPPTPRDLIAGLDRVEDMLSDTIKFCEHTKCPRRTSASPPCMPLGLRNTTQVASHYMKRKIPIESGPKTLYHGNHRGYLNDPCHIHENSKHTAR
jgi:hypothetical protein